VRIWTAPGRFRITFEGRCGARLDKTTGGDSVKGIPNKDEAHGAFDRAKGAVKEAIGSAVGNESLEREGEFDQTKGKVRQELGEARRKVGEKIAELGDNIKS
jgi:uncharacterized protein YjbJ (UPF0337 family)